MLDVLYCGIQALLHVPSTSDVCACTSVFVQYLNWAKDSSSSRKTARYTNNLYLSASFLRAVPLHALTTGNSDASKDACHRSVAHDVVLATLHTTCTF